MPTPMITRSQHAQSDDPTSTAAQTVEPPAEEESMPSLEYDSADDGAERKNEDSAQANMIKTLNESMQLLVSKIGNL